MFVSIKTLLYTIYTRIFPICDENKEEIKMSIPSNVLKIRDKTRKDIESGLQNYVVIFKDGQVKNYLTNPCYSALNYPDRVDNYKDVAYIISYMSPTFSGFNFTEGNIAYANWILKRSPWADCFLTKTGSYALNKGIICHGETPSNILIGGLIALRFIDEYPYIPDIWYRLVKVGIDEHLAFLIANSSHFMNNKQAISISQGPGGHNNFPQMFTPSSWWSFMNNKPSYISATKGGFKYSGVENAWYGGRGDAKERNIMDERALEGVTLSQWGTPLFLEGPGKEIKGWGGYVEKIQGWDVNTLKDLKIEAVPKLMEVINKVGDKKK